MIELYIKVVNSRGVLLYSSLAKTAANALVRKWPNAVGNIKFEFDKKHQHQVRQKTQSNVWDTFAGGSYSNLQTEQMKLKFWLTYKDMLIRDIFTWQMASGD